MNIIFKKSASVFLASLMGAMSFPVFAAEGKSDLQEQKQQAIISVDKKSKETTLKEKEKSESLWSKIPGSAKVFGGAALVAVPVIIGGKIYYNNNIKPTVDAILGIQKLESLHQQFKNKPQRTELDKVISALTIIMKSYIMIGHSSEVCLTQISLLQLRSDEQIRSKINALSAVDLFKFSQLLRLEIAGLTEENVPNIQRELQGQVAGSEIDDFDFMIRAIPQLSGRTLREWNNAVVPMVSARLRELNQKTLNRYGFTVKRSLGNGQSGEVYLCTDASGHEVAVKVMPQQGNMISKLSIKNEKGVWQEIRDLQTENVIKYREQFSRDGMACFSMEYFEGCKELSKVQPRDRNQVIDWVKQIFVGLAALHEKNIAHRDIKLENVLINEATGQIKICDFGLAKRADLTTSICGTPGMMAPEVYNRFRFGVGAGTKYNGAKADVYSAVAVAYCLLFNKTSENISNEREGISSITAEKTDRFGNAIGEDLRNFFRSCSDRDPESRVTCAQALRLLDQVS